MINRSRILIADDHNLVAELCRNLLEAEFQVVGTVSDGRALVRAALELKPDVIVVDIAMPILNGLDAGRQVKAMLPGVKLVYLTMNPDVDVAAEAFARGASAYLLKTCAAAEMVVAVRDVLRGKTCLSKALSRDTIDCLCWQHKKLVNEEERLTDRQREVLQLLAEGKVMKEVGHILHMTTRTVRGTNTARWQRWAPRTPPNWSSTQSGITWWPLRSSHWYFAAQYAIHSYRRSTMPCSSCSSTHQAEFTVEMNIHFRGLENIDNPGVLLIPEVKVCLNCGNSRFMTPQGELTQLVAAIEKGNLCV